MINWEYLPTFASHCLTPPKEYEKMRTQKSYYSIGIFYFSYFDLLTVSWRGSSSGCCLTSSTVYWVFWWLDLSGNIIPSTQPIYHSSTFSLSTTVPAIISMSWLKEESVLESLPRITELLLETDYSCIQLFNFVFIVIFTKSVIIATFVFMTFCLCNLLSNLRY